jgi:hypothetical protein
VDKINTLSLEQLLDTLPHLTLEAKLALIEQILGVCAE